MHIRSISSSVALLYLEQTTRLPNYILKGLEPSKLHKKQLSCKKVKSGQDLDLLVSLS